MVWGTSRLLPVWSGISIFDVSILFNVNFGYKGMKIINTNQHLCWFLLFFNTKRGGNTPCTLPPNKK